MKSFFVLFFLAFSFIANAQNYKLSISQNGKNIKTNKNAVTIEKSPFALIFKFKEKQNLSLISGNDSIMNAISPNNQSQIDTLILRASFGGADSYFNEGLGIKAWNAKVYTTIEYTDDDHHSFDTIYKKGKWIYGVRTVEKLSTSDNSLYVEEWAGDELIIALANNTYTTQKRVVTNGSSIKLNFKKPTSKSVLDVRGKEFIEEGEAPSFQEGCEGCGNLGSYHFIMNGKNVDFLMSGSDTGSFGAYSQIGNQVTIGNDISFTVSEDGNTLVDNKSKTRYSVK